MQVEESDLFGSTVNFAARVVGSIKDAEIWLSEPAKADIDQLRAQRFNKLKWKQNDGVKMKGFPGSYILWSLEQ
jgi:class 3 adenylate cyclase